MKKRKKSNYKKPTMPQYKSGDIVYTKEEGLCIFVKQVGETYGLIHEATTIVRERYLLCIKREPQATIEQRRIDTKRRFLNVYYHWQRTFHEGN